jgi:hypothetical protein
MENIKFPKLAKKPIEILVGFNYPGVHIALAADISGKNIREPSCRKTVFGNTAIYRAMEPPSTIMLTQVMKEARLERLCEQLLEFVEAGLAHVSSKPNSLMSPEDIRALQIVEAGICKKDTGHIQVPIPWAHDNPDLPRNHDEVKRSDAKQEAKLKDKNPEAYCQLCGTIGEWLELDVARPLPPEVDPQDGFYIPKVLVIKNERDSTQCRICMDCSRSYGQPRRSLNDAILIGPKLQGDILEILIRFRMEMITICADVTKMFLNIKLHPDDKKFHRFFHNGTAHLMESSTVSDITRKVIELSLYMDDVIASVKTEEDAVQVYIDLTGLYDKANLCFKKWMSNSKSVLAQIPQENRAKKLELLGELNELPTVTTLGLIYDPEDDTLSYKSPTDVEYDVTKRIIISTISRTFDPQDILAPVTIVGRIIAQELWALGIAANIDWDTKLRQSKDERIKEVLKYWDNHVKYLQRVHEIKIKRPMKTSNDVKHRQLHVFADGSKLAYAAAAYLRIEYNDDRVEVYLVCAKKKQVCSLKLSAGLKIL